MPELDPPVSSRDHRTGGEHAPLTLVEYGDFECPYCARAYGIVRSLRDQLGDDLLYVFRHFPLSEEHPHAELAAEAAEAAAAEGKFWYFHDALFENQERLGIELIVELGESFALHEAFYRDLGRRHYRDRVFEDIETGRRNGVASTPTFFVNGQRHRGDWDKDTLLRALIEGAMGRRAV